MKRMSVDDLLRYVDWTNFMLLRYCFAAGKYPKQCHCARSQNCEKGPLASLCLSVCMEQLGSHGTNFTMKFAYFSKICRKNSSYIKIGQE
jgi:hypothetical protein